MTRVGGGQRQLVVGALAAAVLCAAYVLPLIAFFKTLWAKEHYQHFPFVLAAFAWLAYERVRDAKPRAASDHSVWRFRIALLVGLAAWALLALAYTRPSPWMAYLSFIALVAGIFAAIQSKWRAPGLWGAWAILLLVLPPPLNRDQDLITRLQRHSSQTSSFVLDALGVDHIMEGNALLLPDKQFFVDEACSGIISVASIIACAVIYGVWRRRSALHTILLALAGVGWATLMNTLRISTIAVVHWSWGLDWTEGAPHQAISLCVFMFAFLALMSTDILLAGLLAPVGETWNASHGDPVRWGRLFVAAFDWLQGHGASAAETDDEQTLEVVASPAGSVSRAAPPWRRALFAGGLLAFAALPAWKLLAGNQPVDATPGEISAPAMACLERALACSAESLPAELGGTRRADFTEHERDRKDLMGMYSRSYQFEDAQRRFYTLSCDFPYEGGWHELTVCYRGVGWELNDRRVESDGEPVGGTTWERMEADFSRPDGSRAFLTVCAFDETGMPIPLPTMSLREDLWKALTQRQTARTGVAFQVQVWIVANGPIGPEVRETARTMLLEARDRFRTLIAPTQTAPTEAAAASAKTP
jgi:exosortase